MVSGANASLPCGCEALARADAGQCLRETAEQSRISLLLSDTMADMRCFSG